MKIIRSLKFVRGLIATALLFVPGLALAQIQVAPAPFPPIPATAEFDPAVAADVFSAKQYHIGEIGGMGSGVYWITDGNYHSMAVVHDDGVILVDCPAPLPFFPPMPVLTALAEVTDKPVTHIVYSHGHSDHIGGCGAVKAAFPGAKIVAHKETKKNLQAAADTDRPVPTMTFNRKLSLAVGGQKLDLSYHGNTHQEGNLFAYHAATKTLMVVDIVYPGWVPFRRLALSNDIAGWISGHDAVMSFDFDTLVGGHLTRLGDRDDAVLAKEYVEDIQTSIEAVMLDFVKLFEASAAINAIHDPGAEFFPPGVFGSVAFSTVAKWALFSAFYDASTQACATALEKYQSDIGLDPSKHLGGAETFNFSNCEAYFVARRLGTHQ